MSKSIKVSEGVYQRLLNAQEKRETFSQTVERLLNVRDRILDFIMVVEGMLEYQQWKAQQHQLALEVKPAPGAVEEEVVK